jgi:hypothetical protein
MTKREENKNARREPGILLSYHRHPEVRAKRASKGDGPHLGRSSFEARSLCSLAPQDDGLAFRL